MSNQPKLINSILKAWLVAGTLDITAACINYYRLTQKGPEGVFRYIAKGAFGLKAVTGGWEYILAGLLFHYLIAFCFVAVFFLIYSGLRRWIAPYAVTAGLLYGLIAWCIMNLLVVPASAIPAPAKPPATSGIIINMLFLMFFIGLPAALFARRHYAKVDANR